MTSNYRQLILFDCDGGRASLFNDTTILDQLPSNCECYLFWNKDSDIVTDKLSQLSRIPQIHPCPSVLKNSKNSADGKLIYFLGKLVESFEFILIVHGNDNIYNEVVEAVVYDYDHQKIDQKKIQHPTTKILRELFLQLRKRNEQHNYIDPKPSFTLPKYPVVDKFVNIAKIVCPECSKAFKNISLLPHHIKSKHNRDASINCSCSLKFATIKKFNAHRKQIKQQLISEQGIIHCCNTKKFPEVYLTQNSLPITVLSGKTNQCHFKCRRRYYNPVGLFSHLKAKHGSDIDIRLQCCNPTIKYTFDGFYQHVHSQHDIKSIQ